MRIRGGFLYLIQAISTEIGMINSILKSNLEISTENYNILRHILKTHSIESVIRVGMWNSLPGLTYKV